MTFRAADWPVSGSPERISGIELNQICDIADLARSDPNVIKLWLGEGDLPTPQFVADAAMSALASGHTRYTYGLGIPELREALDRYHKRHWDIDLGFERFSVTAGGTQAIMQAFQAIISPGDEVIVPFPAWPNLVEIVRILGGTVVPVHYRVSETGFTLDLDDVRAAITPKTKIISINSPSNPTGWIMPMDDMITLRDLVREKGLWLISDEVYAHFTFDGTLAPSFLQITEPTDRLIVVNTFSKNWCMTGWRIGWVIFPQGMETVFENLSQYNTTSVATFIQYAAIAALDQGDGFTKALVERSAKARQVICSALDQLPNVRVFWPDGTFYFLFRIDGVDHSYEMARTILRETSVGVAPGTAFGHGADPYFRVCFAVEPERVRVAADKLVEFLGRDVLKVA